MRDTPSVETQQKSLYHVGWPITLTARTNKRFLKILFCPILSPFFGKHSLVLYNKKYILIVRTSVQFPLFNFCCRTSPLTTIPTTQFHEQHLLCAVSVHLGDCVTCVIILTSVLKFWWKWPCFQISFFFVLHPFILLWMWCLRWLSTCAVYNFLNFRWTRWKTKHF